MYNIMFHADKYTEYIKARAMREDALIAALLIENDLADHGNAAPDVPPATRSEGLALAAETV